MTSVDVKCSEKKKRTCGGKNGFRPLSGILSAVLTVLFCSTHAVAADSPLIGRWPLAADAQDASGNGHDGVLKGGAAFSAEDKALVLDGVDSYVNFGDVPIRADFSIGLWLCPDWPHDAKVMRLMGKFRLADLKVLALFSDEKGRLWVYISGDGSEDGKLAIVKATSEPAIAESGRWRFVVVRWDSAKAAAGLSIVVDGAVAPVVSASEANITQLSAKKVDLTLGAYDIQTATEDGVTREVVNNPFRGMMSGLTIWDSVLPDEAVAAAFLAGRTGETRQAAKPPETAAAAPVEPGQASQPTQALKALADNARAVDSELDYNIVFARKQQGLAGLNSLVLSNADIAEAARLAKLLAEDLYSEQRLALARKLRLRWLADRSAMARRTESELVALLDAIWFVCPEQAQEILATWFSDGTLWNAVSGKTLAFAAMLAGKPWSDVEMPGSVIDPSILPAIDARLSSLQASCDRETLADAALAFGYAGDGERSRKWAMKLYDAVLGSVQTRADLGLTDLRQVADVLGQEWLKTTQIEYPEYLEVVLRVAAAGGLPSEKPVLDRLARLCSGPKARQSLVAEIEAHPDASRLPLARVLTAAITQGQDLAAWCRRVDMYLSSSRGDALAFWNMVRGDAEVIRLHPAVPGRRLPWIRKADASVAADSMRLAFARELGDYFTLCGLPGDAADEIARMTEFLAGDKSAQGLELVQSLDKARFQVERKQARFQKLIQHERLKRQQDYLERMRERAVAKGDTARVRELDVQLASVRKEVSR